jgi:hypothetical protein
MERSSLLDNPHPAQSSITRRMFGLSRPRALVHHFNDKLYESGQLAAAWTHLQVRKSDVLSPWPKPEP